MKQIVLGTQTVCWKPTIQNQDVYINNIKYRVAVPTSKLTHLFCYRMPRTYKRKVGSRQYRNYTDGKLEHCLNAIRNREITHREITQREAEAIYKIPRRTIINRLKGNGDESVRKPGY